MRDLVILFIHLVTTLARLALARALGLELETPVAGVAAVHVVRAALVNNWMDSLRGHGFAPWPFLYPSESRSKHCHRFPVFLLSRPAHMETTS